MLELLAELQLNGWRSWRGRGLAYRGETSSHEPLAWHVEAAGYSGRTRSQNAGQGAMRMLSVEDKSELITHFDGKLVYDTGNGDGGALAIKATSPTGYAWTFFEAGKPLISGSSILAADRKSFTRVNWLIAKPEKTRTFVYDKQ